MVDISPYVDKSIDMILAYLPRLILALIVLIVGFRLIRWFGKGIDKAMSKKKMEASLRIFLIKLVTITLKVMLLISIAAMIGIQTTSFIAVLGAAGLAVGLALQGSLANFAGGVLILMFKPFVVGDVIEAQGVAGTVRKIEIFNTIMNTFDNKQVVIPNGILSNGVITNYTAEKKRRVDMVFGIGYDDDIKKASRILHKIINENKKILKTPAPTIRVHELGDSSVKFICRPWCKTEDYWDVYFYVTEQVKLQFDKNKISIPYPQQDVHLKK